MAQERSLLEKGGCRCMAPKKDFKSKSSKKAEKDLTGINELKKALKQKQLGTLYVFHGEEPFLQEYYLKQIRSALLPPGEIPAALGHLCVQSSLFSLRHFPGLGQAEGLPPLLLGGVGLAPL